MIAQHSRVYNPEQVDLSELVRFKKPARAAGATAVHRLWAMQLADPVPDVAIRIRTYTLFDAAWLRAQMIRNDPDSSRGDKIARAMVKAIKADPDPSAGSVSIIDPLSSTGARVVVPMRSWKCQHLRPMDRDSFIAAVSAGRHDWSCVICGASALPTELYECKVLDKALKGRGVVECVASVACSLTPQQSIVQRADNRALEQGVVL